jgi:hypothetical protein
MVDHLKIDDVEFDKRVFRKLIEQTGFKYYLDKNPGLTCEELLEIVNELKMMELLPQT